MRIEKVRTFPDAVRFVVDQVLHGLIVFGSLGPVVWATTPNVWVQLFSCTMILSIREFEQWRGKSAETRFRQSLQPFITRYADRVLDVVLGSLIGVWLLSYL